MCKPHLLHGPIVWCTNNTCTHIYSYEHIIALFAYLLPSQITFRKYSQTTAKALDTSRLDIHYQISCQHSVHVTIFTDTCIPVQVLLLECAKSVILCMCVYSVCLKRWHTANEMLSLFLLSVQYTGIWTQNSRCLEEYENSTSLCAHTAVWV